MEPTNTPITGRVGELDVNIGLLIHYNRTIPVGTTITWTNRGLFDHTTTSGRAEEGPTGLWDSGVMLPEDLAQSIPGETFSYTFNDLGVFPYHCTIHPDRMRGFITVVSGEATPTPPPTPTVTPLPVLESKQVTLEIKSFTLPSATVKVGTTVTFLNPSTGIDLHTVTSGKPRTKDEGKMFKSPALGKLSPQSPTPGGDLPSWDYTFNEAGVFDYFCEFHPTIERATITVVE